MSTATMPRNWPLNVVKVIAFTVLITAIVAAIAPSYWASNRHSDLAVFFLISLIISSVAWIIMPVLGKWTEHQPPLLRWTTLVSALLGAGTVGSAIASAIVHYGFGAGESYLLLLGNTLPVALPITVTVGVITTLIVAGRERLEISRTALATQ